MRSTSSLRFLSIAATIVVGIYGDVQAQNQTSIGSTMTHCSSPTVVGTSSCSDKAARPAEATTPAPKRDLPAKRTQEAQVQAPVNDPVIGGVKESEVSEFLANYGKPSRQAVRALLNPNDDNIAAMLQVEKSQLAVAAYTAQRRVELTQQAGAGTTELNQADLPALIGMRVTVITSADCKGCEKVLPFVNQLVTEFPSVDARIGVLGLTDAKEFVIKAAEIGVYLPVSKISVERVRQLRLESLPAVLVGDTRYAGESVVLGAFSSALDLERAIVQVRKANEKRHVGVSQTGKGEIQ